MKITVIMNKKEAKQWLRNLIDSSIKIQDNKDKFYLYYNKSYLRALKLSKITGQSVNKENFNGGVELFSFYINSKYFDFSSKIYYYLKKNYYFKKNYSNEYRKINKLVEEVLYEYEEYKGYKL